MREFPEEIEFKPSFEEIKYVAVGALPTHLNVGSAVAVAFTVPDGSIVPKLSVLPVVLVNLQLLLERMTASAEMVVAFAAKPSIECAKLSKPIAARATRMARCFLGLADSWMKERYWTTLNPKKRQANLPLLRN